MNKFVFSINNIFSRKNILFALGLSIVLLLSGIYNFMFFHIVVELFSIFVAFSIFILVFYSKDRIDNNYLIVLGTSFLFIGSFDFIHTLTYKGMGLFNYNQSNIPTQLWLIARYLESFSILAAVILVDRIETIKFKRIFNIYLLISLIIVLTLILGFFPDAFLEESGLTSFKRISEYIISAILAAALILAYKNKKKFNQDIFKLIMLSITITILSEMSFTFYNSVYGLSNIVGHILKFISFYLIYQLMLKKIITEPQEFLFKKLKSTKEKWNLAANTANLGLWELDLENNEIYFDDNFSEMLGYSQGELEKDVDQLKNLIHPEDLTVLEHKLLKFIKSDSDVFNVEYRMKAKNGQYKWICNTGQTTAADAENKAIKLLGIHQDIDQNKKIKDRLKYLSFHDYLTDLYNRRYFENELKRLNDSRRYPVSIIVTDIDNLKIVNDTMGHKMGDKYIKTVAQIFTNVLRSEDIAARIGGDEIAVILPETDPDDVKMICSRIEEKCEKINKGDNEFKNLFRVSIGCHSLNHSAHNLNYAFQKADKKMYQDKRNYKCKIK
jgi:diguanylate cyclase (GGDEF)-like protein/PAS domain S-box-containing protein